MGERNNSIDNNIPVGKESSKAGLMNSESNVPANNFSQDLIAEAYNLSKMGCWTYDFILNKFECTNEIYEILEIPYTTDISKYELISDFFPLYEKNKLNAMRKQVSKNVNQFDFKIQVIIPDGSTKYIEIKSKLKRDENLNPTLFIGTVKDITDEHFKFERLKESEEIFRSLFNELTDIFIVFEPQKDADGKIVDYIYKDVNPVFEMKFDLSRSEIINQPFSNQIQLFQQFDPILKITAISGEAQQNSFFIQTLDSFVEVLIYSPSENLIATIWRDVSLSIEANSTLRENEEKYRQLFSIGNDGVIITEYLSGKILDVNPAACNIFSYSKEDLVRMLFKELFTEKERVEFELSDKKNTNINCNAIKKNGAIFPSETSLSHFNWNGRKMVVASIRDISDREKTQKELIKSENKFKQLFDLSNDAILIIKDYKIVEFNQKSQEVFGVSPSFLFDKTLWSLSPSMQINGDNSRVKILEYIQQALQGNQVYFEWIFHRDNEKIFYADLKLSPIFFEEDKIIQVIVRDVSQRKIAENQLVQQENRWKHSLDISSTGVWEWNVITNEVYFSPVWKSLLGYENDEIENKFEEFEKRIHPDDLDRVYSHIEAYFSAKTSSYSVNFRIRCKNGSYKWINAKGKIYSFTTEGKAEHFVGTHTDITKHKKTEEELLEINLNYADTIREVKVGYWTLDIQKMLLNGIEETFEIFGLNKKNSATLKSIENLVHPEDQELFISQFISNNNLSKKACTFRVIVENSTQIIHSVSSPIFDVNNTLVGFKGVFQDITNFKKQDIELIDEHKLSKSFIENSSQSIVAIQDNKIVYTNTKFNELTGYKSSDFHNLKFIDLIVLEDKPKALKLLTRFSISENIQANIELRLETKHRRIKWINLIFSSTEFYGSEAILIIIDDISLKKNLETKFELNENQLNNIKNLAPIGIACFDLDEKLYNINSEFGLITGILLSKSSKASLKDMFSTADYKLISESIEKIKNLNHDHIDLELELKNENFVHLKICSISNESQPLSFILFIHNKEHIRKQIDKLSEENFNFKAIVNQTSFGIGVFNHKQELMVNNLEFKNILPFSSLINLVFNDLNFNKKNFTLSFESLINSLETIKFNCEFQPNKITQVEFKSISLDKSKGLLMIVYDISDETRRNNTLLNQFEKFESLFLNAPIGIALVDKNRSIIECNKSYAKTLKIPQKELYHKKLDEIIRTENLSELVTHLSELFADVNPNFGFLSDINDKNGNKVWLNSNFAQIKDRFNEVSFAIHVINDITTFKKNEDSIVNNERIKTLNYLANSFAHDFNNQLMAMYGNSYLLKSNLTDEKLKNYADSLFNTIIKASELTYNLLSFSMNNKKISVITNIPDLFDNLIDTINIPPTISTITYFEKKNENIIADPSMLQRTFLNIIENALEAMPSGGNLTIETKSVYFNNPNSTVNKLEKGKYLRISIKDTGKGINTQNLPHIFDPFFSTKTTELNAGLGLTIAQKSINEHHGTIKVESSNSGTMVMVYLPQDENDVMKESIQPDEQLIIKGSANLLTIDDEDVVRIVTGELLKKLGYNVFSFSGGARALKFYKKNMDNIDLVLLDKHMPEMDGAIVYQKLKKLNPEVKVILMTGFNIDNEIQAIFQHKNSAIIQKPVNVEKLSNTISNLLIHKK